MLYGRSSWGYFRTHFERGMRVRDSIFAPCQADAAPPAGGAGGGGGQGGGGGAAGGGAAGGDPSAGAGSGSGEGGGAGAGAGQGQAARGTDPGAGGGDDRRLTRENQTLRSRLKAMRQEIGTLLGEEGEGGGSPDDRRRQPDPDAVALRREIDDLKVKDSKRDLEALKLKVENGVDKALLGLNLTDAEEAREALLRKVRTSAEKAGVGDVYLAADGKLVTKVKDGEKEREVEVTPARVAELKLLKPIYFRPAGVGGAGSRSAAQAGSGANSPADRSKINDPDYYKEHREDFLKQARMPRV